jgi:hypothetical protein
MEHSKYEAKAHTSCGNKLIESLFKVLLFLYRLGGSPLNEKSVSRLKTVYNVSIIVCFCITYFCASVDSFIHRHQLSIAMKNIRIFLGMLMITWLQFSVR